MPRIRSGAAVPRQHVFVLADGSFVVQWNETRVQDLLTGGYRPFATAQFGHAMSDVELEQMQAAGRVEHFDHAFVWLYALPENGRFSLRVQEEATRRARGYYLNTTLPESLLGHVCALLKDAGLDGELTALVRAGLVTVVPASGRPFPALADAESALRRLLDAEPELFRPAAVAFVELPDLGKLEGEPLDLATLIAAQTDTTRTAGKRALVICRNPADQGGPLHVLRDLRMDYQVTTGGMPALDALKRGGVQLVLVLGTRIPDMPAGAELLARLPAGAVLIALPAGDDEAYVDLATDARATVLSGSATMARLRQAIWMTLGEGPP